MAVLSRRLCMVVALVALAGLALALPFGLLRAKQAAHPGARTAQSAAKTASDGKASEVAKLNNLGVAYMNQGRFEPAQKLFEQALAADPHYALARLNLGLALLSQQKLEAARAPGALPENYAKSSRLADGSGLRRPGTLFAGGVCALRGPGRADGDSRPFCRALHSRDDSAFGRPSHCRGT